MPDPASEPTGADARMPDAKPDPSPERDPARTRIAPGMGFLGFQTSHAQIKALSDLAAGRGVTVSFLMREYLEALTGIPANDAPRLNKAPPKPKPKEVGNFGGRIVRPMGD